MTDKIYYTWEELEHDTNKICEWVNSIGFVPDAVVGIIRGGAIPAIIASHLLGCKCILFNWSLRDGGIKDTKKIDELAIYASHGHKLLFVDDIVDSGETMHQIKERMFDTNQNVLYTSLWYNPSQKTGIHYWSRVVDRDLDKRWVVFPYEKHE